MRLPFVVYNKAPIEHTVYFGDIVYYSYGNGIIIDNQSRVAGNNHYTQDIFWFIENYVKTTFLEDTVRPYMIIMTEGHFSHLQNINLDSQHIDMLNTQGLDIYIWETPNLGKTLKSNLITNNDYDVLKVTNNQSLRELAGFPYKTPLICYELEPIKEFIQRNKLKNTQIYSGLYNFEDTITKDLNLSAQCNVNTFGDVAFCEYKESEKFDTDIDTNMICFNKRYDFFREIVCAHLLDKNCKLSFIPKHTDIQLSIKGKIKPLSKHKEYWQNIDLRAWENISNLLEDFPDLPSKIKKLNKQQHFIDNLEHKDIIGWVDQKSMPSEYTKSAFCSIVNECTFAWPYAHISEKTLMPIKVFRPFLLVAPPYSLEYMHKLGFKTFDKWFDESYDTETHHVKRMSKLFSEIDKLHNYSYNECKEMLNDMKDVLEHNFHNLKRLLKQKGI